MSDGLRTAEGIRITPVRDLDCRFEPRSWPFATRERERIEEHWRRLVARKPAMFNGRVLVMHRWQLERGVFSGAFLETDYASFLAWRDFGFPDAEVRNCFAMGALTSREGHFVLGIMGEHTANAGRIYFPAGTPDPGDIAGENVDFTGSVLRELEEETGLTAAQVRMEDGWTVVAAGPRVALMRRVLCDLPRAELEARVLGHIAGEVEPELSGIHVVATQADLSRAMPDFQRAYLEHALAR